MSRKIVACLIMLVAYGTGIAPSVDAGANDRECGKRSIELIGFETEHPTSPVKFQIAVDCPRSSGTFEYRYRLVNASGSKQELIKKEGWDQKVKSFGLTDYVSLASDEVLDDVWDEKIISCLCE